MAIINASSKFFTNINGNIAYNNKYRLDIATSLALRGLIKPKSGVDVNEYLSLMCTNTVFPSIEMSEDAFVYNDKGQKIPLYGDITFDNKFEATFYNSEDHDVRLFFIHWMNRIHSFKNGTKADLGTDLYTNARVLQQTWLQGTSEQGTTGEAGYKFSGLFPVRVGDIALDDRPPITVQQFTVTFSFFNFEPITEHGNLFDNFADGILNSIADDVSSINNLSDLADYSNLL